MFVLVIVRWHRAWDRMTTGFQFLGLYRCPNVFVKDVKVLRGTDWTVLETTVWFCVRVGSWRECWSVRVLLPRAECHTVRGTPLHVTCFSLFSKLVEARPYLKRGSHFKPYVCFVSGIKHFWGFRNEEARNASVSCIMFVRQTVWLATRIIIGFHEILYFNNICQIYLFIYYFSGAVSSSLSSPALQPLVGFVFLHNSPPVCSILCSSSAPSVLLQHKVHQHIVQPSCMLLSLSSPGE